MVPEALIKRFDDALAKIENMTDAANEGNYRYQILHAIAIARQARRENGQLLVTSTEETLISQPAVSVDIQSGLACHFQYDARLGALNMEPELDYGLIRIWGPGVGEVIEKQNLYVPDGAWVFYNDRGWVGVLPDADYQAGKIPSKFFELRTGGETRTWNT